MITLDRSRREVVVEGKEVKLPPKEFGLLEALILADGKVLDRKYIIEKALKSKAKLDSRTVDAHIARLRHGIKDKRGIVIRTVVGAGYKLARGAALIVNE